MCPVRVPIWFPFFCALFTGLLFWSLPTAGEESERPPVRCWFANYAQPFLVQRAKRVDLVMANDGKMAQQKARPLAWATLSGTVANPQLKTAVYT